MKTVMEENQELKKWNRWLMIGFLIMLLVFGIYTQKVDRREERYQYQINDLQNQVRIFQIESN